jgi:type I restriction enzyme R subunit
MDLRLNEKNYVEQPLLKQLKSLGWQVIDAEADNKKGLYDPEITLRESFSEVVLKGEIKSSLVRLNPWLEDDQLAELMRPIINPKATALLAGNMEIYNKLIQNGTAFNRTTEEADKDVTYIDFDDAFNKNMKKSKNSYIAISQFKVKIPGTENHIIPDIVLFVNGIPVVVIECKSPTVSNSIGEGIEQLMRYQNRRQSEFNEGCASLFYYNQLLIVTDYQKAVYSSITGEAEHYIQWKDPYPYTLADIGEGNISSQQVLVQGMLTPTNLIDIIASYVLYQEADNGKMIKIVPRYQQFRAVSKIVKRLQGETTPEKKGGTVWHTQGSGKSLTMLFVAQKINRIKELKGYKIVYITDRKDLQEQLSKTATQIGVDFNVAINIRSLKALIRNDVPDIVMGMVHKFRESDLKTDMGELNRSSKILVMIDEAHRTQYKILGANLTKAMPNAVKIAFTGTPVEKTEKTFGDYIDRYSIRMAVEDEVTVEIVYEGRTHNSFITDKDGLDSAFEDVFGQCSDDERKLIQGKYTWRAYLELNEVIEAKAKDMLDHYVQHIFPNGFKAQVVAVSKEAAYRYKLAFDRLLQEKCRQLRKSNSNDIDVDLLEKVKAEAIFSHSGNDDPKFLPFTDEAKHKQIKNSFKAKYEKETDDGNVGILVVQSMLLTGFDAPIEQVMYLDNIIKEHNLLQAIARVNRTEKNKYCGFVVDYVGVSKHLRNALSIYDEKDIAEILEVIKDSDEDIEDLERKYEKIIEFVNKLDVIDLSDVNGIIDELADYDLRNEYFTTYKQLLKAFDKVLPNVAALKYVNELRLLAFVSQTIANVYRDTKFAVKDASKKVRDILEDYLKSQGISLKIPPLAILSDDFTSAIKTKSNRAKCEEITQQVKEYISYHEDEDPELYERFSERLESMLQKYNENWEELYRELEVYVRELKKGREGEETFGFDPRTEMPFLAYIRKIVFTNKKTSEITEKEVEKLIEATRDIIDRINEDSKLPMFWDNPVKKDTLRKFIARHLLEVFYELSDNKDVPHRKELAQRLLETAYKIYGNGR